MDQMGHARYQLPSPTKLFTPAVVVLLVLMVVGLGASSYMPGWVAKWMSLTPRSLFQGKVWQLVTYPYFGRDPMSLMMQVMLILSVGSAVEREWRTKGLVGLWLVTSIGGGLLWSLVCLALGNNRILMGAGPCIYGLIAAMGLLYRGRRMMFIMGAVEAHVLAWIFIGIGIVFSIPNPLNLIQVAGAPIAYGYIKLLWWSRDRTCYSGGDRNDSGSRGFVEID